MEGEKYRPKAEDVQNDLDEVTGLLKAKIKIIFSTEIHDPNKRFFCFTEKIFILKKATSSKSWNAIINSAISKAKPQISVRNKLTNRTK